MVNIVLLVIGCFLDPTSAILVFAPLLVPIAVSLGIDPIHFGIVMTVNLAIGMFTPPFGLNIFVAQSVTGLPAHVLYAVCRALSWSCSCLRSSSSPTCRRSRWRSGPRFRKEGNIMLTKFFKLAALSTALALAPMVSASAQTTMKLATATINDVQHEWQKVFARELEARAPGAVKTEIYPASQLGAIPRMAEGVLLGTIEAFTTPTSFMTNVDPRFQAFDVPGLFKTPDDVHAAIHDPDTASTWRRCSSTRAFA